MMMFLLLLLYIETSFETTGKINFISVVVVVVDVVDVDDISIATYVASTSVLAKQTKI